jgi:hypothetical protein
LRRRDQEPRDGKRHSAATQYRRGFERRLAATFNPRFGPRGYRGGEGGRASAR